AAGLDDLAHDLRSYAEDMEMDPERSREVEERLTLLGELRRKYGRTLDEILAFGEAASHRRSELDGLLERADRIDAEVSSAWDGVVRTGAELAAARRRAAAELAGAARAHLLDLGFVDPHVEVTVEDAEPRAVGADEVTLLFASDSRLTPGPVATVASGGELSRLVLALRLVGGRGEAEKIGRAHV